MKIAAALVLAIGLSVGAGIYFFAPEPDQNAAMYEVGVSKQYNRTLRQFGGRQAVLFDEFQTWFGSLWRGKQLGVTIGWLSVGAALMLYFVARRR